MKTNNEETYYRGQSSKKRYENATCGFEKNDILRYSFMDNPVRLYRVLNVLYWEDYEDAVAELVDIETGEEASMNCRVSGLHMHKKAESKVFGWVQDKGQSGWKWRDITDTVGLQHIGENCWQYIKRMHLEVVS